jgi:hypothetical protein
MRIPKFHDLTLRQYIQIEEIKARAITGDCPEADRACLILAAVTGKPFDYFQSLPINNLYTYTARLENIDPPKELAFRKHVRVGFRRLRATMSLNDMSTAQMIDYMSLQKNGAPLNDMLAVMYVPGKYRPELHGKISAALLDKKVGSVLGLVFFYSDYLKTCSKRMQESLQSLAEFQKNLLEEIRTDKGFLDFLTAGGGNTTLINALKTSA